MTTPARDDWKRHLLESPAEISALIARTHRIAVLGIKTPETGEPAYYVPAYAQRAGFEIIPVPVYFEECIQILGRPIFRRLVDIPGDIDMVDVFRREHKIMPHMDDILAKKPKSVWFQLGIRNDEAAERLAKAGIDVVQDHCLMVEMQNVGR